METALFTLLGTLVGGLISYFLQKQRFEQELRFKQEEDKTGFMAETTAKNFLNHKNFTDRSFDTLRKHLGGFDDDELRKILVRSGAIRTYRGMTALNGGDFFPEWTSLLRRKRSKVD